MIGKLMANNHVKRYVEAVFAGRLREEGFVCPDDKLLCWYRVTNDNIVNSIIFYSVWSSPLVLFAGYSIHPLFQNPVFTASAVFKDRPFESELFCEQALVEDYPVNSMCYSNFSHDIPVMVPGVGGRGIYTLDGIILPKMKQAASIEACYQMHKDSRLRGYCENVATKFRTVAGVFIDEAIYVGDSEVYPYCMESTERHIEQSQKRCAAAPHKRALREALNEWELRKAALAEGGREEYLPILNARLEANRKALQKKLGAM